MKETPHYHIDHIMADHFRRGVTYTNWRSRGTNDWLLILTIGGSGHVASGRADIVTRRGTVTLYQPNTPQHYFTDPGAKHWDLVWSHFQPRSHWRSWLNWPEQSRGLRSLVLHDEELIRQIGSAMLDAVRFRRQPLPGSIDLAYNALERAILWINSVNLHRTLDERVRRAANLLVERLAEPFSLARLARECSLSVSRLAHLFREQVGTPPQLYHEQLRLQWAAELLRTSGLSVGEIAAEVGYANAFYFSARFKKTFGKSPLHYRRACERGRA